MYHPWSNKAIHLSGFPGQTPRREFPVALGKLKALLKAKGLVELKELSIKGERIPWDRYNIYNPKEYPIYK